MTRDETANAPGPEIILKFEHISEGAVTLHASYREIDQQHMAIAIDHLQKEVGKMLLLHQSQVGSVQ
jgi:hypothetical protein